MQTCISILEKIERQEFKHYKELQLEQYTYGSFVESTFECACDICLENKKAILAIPGLQETPWTPHLAYFDTQLNCYSCKKEFCLRKKKKRLGMNRLNFQSTSIIIIALNVEEKYGI